jgi:hypothetical protein
MIKFWYLLSFVYLLSSCTKDRFPIPDNQNNPGEEGVIYFWDFNDGNTVDFGVPIVSSGTSSLSYSGVWDYTDGSLINAPQSSAAGSSLRLRNPAGSFVIQVSTLGFKKIKLSYAVMRTSNGAQENLISYSLDGVNFFDSGIEPSMHSVAIVFELKEVDLSLVNALNNQPQVYVKIDFNMGNTNPTGNNRFDNLTIRATSI